MTRRCCVVCRERPASDSAYAQGEMCPKCESSCLGRNEHVLLWVASRARMYERRRWTGLLKQAISECDAAAARTNWDDTSVASKMECAARASLLRAILMTGTKARK